MRKMKKWDCSSGTAWNPSRDSEQLMNDAKAVFDMAVKDESGCLDMRPLCAARNYARRQSQDYVDAFVGTDDVDLSGTVSREEWIAYFQKLSKDRVACGEVLGLFKARLEQQLQSFNSSNFSYLKSEWANQATG